MKVLDASGQVLGRLSSRLAKMLLDGEKITVINADKVVVTGDPEMVVKAFGKKKVRGDPHHGPYYPKTSNGILRRSVRGMLPYKKAKGREAIRRLYVYAGNPKDLSGERIGKTTEQIECKYINLGKISEKLRGI